MKKIIILTFIIIYSFLSAKTFDFYSYLEIDNYYQSNILKYSKQDISDFKDNTNIAKYRIDTLDDFVTSVKFDFRLKHRIFAGHTQINRFVYKFDKYNNNYIKDNDYICLGLTQYLSKKLDFSFNYYFYPEIYVRQYQSVLDEESIYRSFSYSKNVYNSFLNWKVLPLIDLDYKFEFSQLYYNEFFTEYDAKNIENRFGLGLNITKNLKMDARYSYKTSDADAEDAFNEPERIDVIKDASYQANIYFGRIIVTKFLNLFKYKLDLSSSLKFEQRYFQSEYLDDSYHYGRDDEIIRINNDLKITFSKKFSAKVFYNFEKRNTDSIFDFVIEDKEYSFYEVGSSLRFRF